MDSSVTVVQKKVLRGLPSPARSDYMIIWINGADRVSNETVLWLRWGSFFILSDKGLKLETSVQKRWPIYIFNLVDKTKLSCYPYWRSTTVSLETYPLCSVINRRWHQNVARTKKWHTRHGWVCHWGSYHILTYSVIYYCKYLRQQGIDLFYMTREGNVDNGDVVSENQ